MRKFATRLGRIASIGCLSLAAGCAPEPKIVVQSVNTLCNDVPPTPKTHPLLRAFFAEHEVETQDHVNWVLLVTRRRDDQCKAGGPR